MLTEYFVDSVYDAEEKDGHHHWYNHMGAIIFVVLFKLFFDLPCNGTMA